MSRPGISTSRSSLKIIVNRYFLKLAETRVLFFTAFFFVFLSVILFKLDAVLRAGSGYGYVDLELTFFPDNFFGVVSAWGRPKTELFAKTLWLDYLYPVFYAAFLSGVITRVAGKAGGFAWLPVLAGILDFLENSFHLFAVTNLSLQPLPVVLFSASIFAVLKWSAVLSSVVVILSLLFSRFCRRSR